MIPQFAQYILLLTKIFAIAGSLVYLIFAGLIVKQVSTMTKNVQDMFNFILVIFSYIHLALSLLLILLIWLIL